MSFIMVRQSQVSPVRLCRRRHEHPETLEDDLHKHREHDTDIAGDHFPEILRSFSEHKSEHRREKRCLFFWCNKLYIVMEMRKGAHTLSLLRITYALMRLFAHVHTYLSNMFRNWF